MCYRNTRVYQKSLELVRATQAVIGELPSGCGFLADQLRRASSSVVLNLAEGCGKNSVPDRRRFFGIARGSAYEVAAAIDVAAALGATTEAHHEACIELCDHVGAMLTRFASTQKW